MPEPTEGKQHTLSIPDALVLRSLLLEMGGDYATVKLAGKLAEDIFSTQELETYQVRNTPEGVFWATKDAQSGKPLPLHRTVELGPAASAMIRTTLRKLSEAKALKQHHLSLYERFVQLSSPAPDQAENT